MLRLVYIVLAIKKNISQKGLQIKMRVKFFIIRTLRDLKKFKSLYCILFLINILHWPLYSQYDTTHYIPYFGDLTGANKMSNLEYESSFGGAYIMFSTFEPGPVNVKVYRRTNSGTAWTTQSIYNQNIYRVNLERGILIETEPVSFLGMRLAVVNTPPVG